MEDPGPNPCTTEFPEHCQVLRPGVRSQSGLPEITEIAFKARNTRKERRGDRLTETTGHNDTNLKNRAEKAWVGIFAFPYCTSHLVKPAVFPDQLLLNLSI